ncbi:B-cell receptor CD22-like [Astyanax mexicanus]|uniref:B-cell receptor CD22-like n=1 Tax=Astyanax mexicanus TaxID=7994 RepID=UPI0020CB3874|nr:B-cell receptor CD22-like [Astyanax mexicanus]
MMSLKLVPPLLIGLLIVNGVGAQYEWEVTYRTKSICALKGSTVIMDCTYSYPAGHTVKTAFWTKSLPPAAGVEPPDLLDDPEYRDRVQYGNNHNCRLSLRDVRENDQSKYYFRFITKNPEGKYQGADGVDLSVTGLQVEVPERVMEGDKVTLTCKTTCSLTDRTSFTWYRNGAPLSSSTEKLYLQSVSREDAGRYSCAVLDKNLHSPEVTLNVLDLQVDLQVEVPERVMEGDKVTLTCKTTCSLTDSSSFTWYRNGAALSSRTEQLYLQSVSREDAGRYSCAVLDQKLHSPVVTLNIRYPPKSVSVSISPSGEIVEGSSVTLTCSSDGNPPVEYNWYKGSSSVATGKTFTLNKISSVNSGEYKCRSSNKHGEKYSDTVTLNVLYPPKNISVSIRPSGEIVEGCSVTLTCSSDGNSPVQKYTWFKDGGSSPVGSGHSYSFTLDSESSGQYYCEAQNEHGSKRSEAVLLSFKGNPSVTLYVIGGVVVGGVGLTLLLVIYMYCTREHCTSYILWRKRRGPVTEDPKTKQENINSSVEVEATSNDPPADAANQDDGLYARVELLRPQKSRTEECSAVSHEEVQYSTIQHHHVQEAKKTGEEYDVQYASVSFSCTTPDYRCFHI